MNLEFAYYISWHLDSSSPEQIADAINRLDKSIANTKPHTVRGRNAREARARLMRFVRHQFSNLGEH